MWEFVAKFLNVSSISDLRIQDQFKQKGFSMLLFRIINRVEIMALLKKETWYGAFHTVLINSNSKESETGWRIYGEAELVHKIFTLKQLLQNDDSYVQILF